MSANEGLNTSDIIVEGCGRRVIDFLAAVHRGLQKELFAPPLPCSRADNLIEKLEHCYLTGICLYKPNLCIVLCFLVEVDCTADEAIAATIRAEHASFEFEPTFATPKFTYDGMNKFYQGKYH